MGWVCNEEQWTPYSTFSVAIHLGLDRIGRSQRLEIEETMRDVEVVEVGRIKGRPDMSNHRRISCIRARRCLTREYELGRDGVSFSFSRDMT